VDWSGRATGERRHLWLAELVGDEPTPGRLWNASRAEAGDQLIELAEHDDELLVGLDFGFSLPAWFLHEHGIQDVEELWQDTARLERWLTACEPPFWGRPGRRCPPADQHRPALRWCERAAGRPAPKSVFQVGGAGSVGTGSLRGMPLLHRLRRAGFSIWPFDPPRPPAVFEVWPKHHTIPPIVKSNATARRRYPGVPAAWREQTDASEDAFDAAVAALGMAARCHELERAPTPDDPTVKLEGWIWGVPLPACISSGP